MLSIPTMIKLVLSYIIFITIQISRMMANWVYNITNKIIQYLLYKVLKGYPRWIDKYYNALTRGKLVLR